MNQHKSMGLLQKASLLSQKKGLAFCDFLKSNKITKCAVFSLHENEFLISNSYGFDGKSILASKSTLDFWTGVLPQKNTIYIFSEENKNISSLLQFFSFSLIDSIKLVSIIRTNDRIFMFCNYELSETLKSEVLTLTYDLPEIELNNFNINKDSVVQKYVLDINDAINEFSETQIKSLVEETKSAIYNEIKNRLYFIFSGKHYFSCLESQSEFHIIVDSNFELSSELLQQHITLTVSDVLDKYSNLINITFFGKSDSYSDILEFLKAN